MSDIPPFSCPAFKALVAHLLQSNLPEILAKSRLHCHAHNLHSIMLLEAPGKTIRVFVAEPGHTLWRNFPENIESGMSVGFHPHHCDLTLVGLRGTFFNWIVRSGNELVLPRFRYRSALRGEKPGFEKMGTIGLRTHEGRFLTAGASVSMRATDVHTVAALTDRWSAWLVLEGGEDTNYEPFCYSTAELETESFDHLYKPMSESKLRELLKEANLL